MTVAPTPRKTPPPVRRQAPPPGSKNQISPFKRGRRPPFKRKPTGGRAGGGSFRPRKTPKGKIPTGLVHSTLRHLAPELIAELWPTRPVSAPSATPQPQPSTPNQGQPLGLSPDITYRITCWVQDLRKDAEGNIFVWNGPYPDGVSVSRGDISLPYRFDVDLEAETTQWAINHNIGFAPSGFSIKYVGVLERRNSQLFGGHGDFWSESEITDFQITELGTGSVVSPPWEGIPLIPVILVPIPQTGTQPLPIWKPVITPVVAPPVPLPAPSIAPPVTVPAVPIPPLIPVIAPPVTAPNFPTVDPAPITPPPMPITPPPSTPSPATTPAPPGIGTEPTNPTNPFATPPLVPGITNLVGTPDISTREGRNRQKDIDRLERLYRRQFNPGGNPIPTSTPTSPCSISGNPCQQNLDAGIRRNQQSLNNQQQDFDDLFGAVNAGGQAVNLAVLNTINSKLGPQVAGGLSGFLGRMSQRFKLPEILNAISLIVALHNAAMLSKSLATTLGDVVSQGLSLIGLKDEDGDAHDVNEIIGDAVDNLMKNLLGEQVWNDTQVNWKKASRVYQSAANILSSVQSMVDATRSITEWTGENLGKIGNALKRGGIVAENAYNWLPEQMSAANSRQRSLDKFRDGIGEIEDSVSAFGSVISEVKSIQDEVSELAENKQEFEKNIKELGIKGREDNEPVKDQFNDLKNANQASDYERKDLYNAQEEDN